ncbi:MAG: hypothetical protein KTR35_10495 [Gammaproteobacteria bacterium]|nr:hypothetical protein [Gammaproteobacteria bacterium]
MLVKRPEGVLIGLLILYWSSCAIASEEVDRPYREHVEAGRQLLSYSGVDSHLQSVHATVLSEAQDNRITCQGESPNSSDIQSLLDEFHNPSILVDAAAQQLTQLLNAQDKTELKKWFFSSAALKMMAVEKRFAEATEEEYVQALEHYETSQAITEERHKKIVLLNQLTGASRFVTLLNSEITVAVALLSGCKTDGKSQQVTNELVDAARADKSLVSFFLQVGMNADLAFIYSPLSDSELNEVLEFAQSDLGQRYHRALLSVTDQVLQRQNASLSQRRFGL